MNLKCNKMFEYGDFHRDWMQRIYEVKDSKNILWKQVYLAALHSRFVYYIRLQEVFIPFESYTWREIYSIITEVLVGFCTRSKVKKSLEKISIFPDSKSICSRYGLNLDDPLVKRRKSKRRAKKERKQTTKFHKRTRRVSSRTPMPHKGYYKYVPRIDYYKPSYIHLHGSKREKWNKLTYWLCGKTGHTSNKVLGRRRIKEK